MPPISLSTVFAFYPNKQMTTGEGGMIVTDRDDWDALFRSLRNQGRDVFDAWLNHTRLGYNYRLDEMSAALGLAQPSRPYFTPIHLQPFYRERFGYQKVTFPSPRAWPALLWRCPFPA